MAEKTKRTRQQIGKASKAKGARFELEIADIEGVPGLWIECKHQEKMQLYPWMNQAVRDCTAKNTGDIPVVVHKQNRKETLVTLSLNDFFKLFSSYRKGGC